MQRNLHLLTISYSLTLSDQGYGIFEIRRELVRRGYKTVTGKDYWHLSTLQNILRNKKYKGDYYFKKHLPLII